MREPRPRRPRILPPEPEEDDGFGPSRTELRAERQLVQDRLEALTKTLSELPIKRLLTLGLDDKVLTALRELAAMTKGSALARQRRGVATMLREYDLDDLTKKIARTHTTTTAPAKATTPAEDWRERLMSEGDRGLDALLEAYPAADRQRFRQALRAATAERKEGKTNRRAKELLAMLSTLLA